MCNIRIASLLSLFIFPAFPLHRVVRTISIQDPSTGKYLSVTEAKKDFYSEILRSPFLIDCSDSLKRMVPGEDARRLKIALTDSKDEWALIETAGITLLVHLGTGSLLTLSDSFIGSENSQILPIPFTGISTPRFDPTPVLREAPTPLSAIGLVHPGKISVKLQTSKRGVTAIQIGEKALLPHANTVILMPAASLLPGEGGWRVEESKSIAVFEDLPYPDLLQNSRSELKLHPLRSKFIPVGFTDSIFLQQLGELQALTKLKDGTFAETELCRGPVLPLSSSNSLGCLISKKDDIFDIGFSEGAAIHQFNDIMLSPPGVHAAALKATGNAVNVWLVSFRGVFKIQIAEYALGEEKFFPVSVLPPKFGVLPVVFRSLTTGKEILSITLLRISNFSLVPIALPQKFNSVTSVGISLPQISRDEIFRRLSRVRRIYVTFPADNRTSVVIYEADFDSGTVRRVSTFFTDKGAKLKLLQEKPGAPVLYSISERGSLKELTYAIAPGRAKKISNITVSKPTLIAADISGSSPVYLRASGKTKMQNNTIYEISSGLGGKEVKAGKVGWIDGKTISGRTLVSPLTPGEFPFSFSFSLSAIQKLVDQDGQPSGLRKKEFFAKIFGAEKPEIQTGTKVPFSPDFSRMVSSLPEADGKFLHLSGALGLFGNLALLKKGILAITDSEIKLPPATPEILNFGKDNRISPAKISSELEISASAGEFTVEGVGSALVVKSSPESEKFNRSSNKFSREYLKDPEIRLFLRMALEVGGNASAYPGVAGFNSYLEKLKKAEETLSADAVEDTSELSLLAQSGIVQLSPSATVKNFVSQLSPGIPKNLPSLLKARRDGMVVNYSVVAIADRGGNLLTEKPLRFASILSKALFHSNKGKRKFLLREVKAESLYQLAAFSGIRNIPKFTPEFLAENSFSVASFSPAAGGEDGIFQLWLIIAEDLPPGMYLKAGDSVRIVNLATGRELWPHPLETEKKESVYYLAATPPLLLRDGDTLDPIPVYEPTASGFGYNRADAPASPPSFKLTGQPGRLSLVDDAGKPLSSIDTWGWKLLGNGGKDGVIVRSFLLPFVIQNKIRIHGLEYPGTFPPEMSLHQISANLVRRKKFVQLLSTKYGVVLRQNALSLLSPVVGVGKQQKLFSSSLIGPVISAEFGKLGEAMVAVGSAGTLSSVVSRSGIFIPRVGGGDLAAAGTRQGVVTFSLSGSPILHYISAAASGQEFYIPISPLPPTNSYFPFIFANSRTGEFSLFVRGRNLSWLLLSRDVVGAALFERNDGKMNLLLQGHDRRLRSAIFDRDSGSLELLRTFDFPCRELIQNGQYALVRSKGNSVHLFDLKTFFYKDLTLPRGKIIPLTWNGRYLLITSREGFFRLTLLDKNLRQLFELKISSPTEIFRLKDSVAIAEQELRNGLLKFTEIKFANDTVSPKRTEIKIVDFGLGFLSFTGVEGKILYVPTTASILRNREFSKAFPDAIPSLAIGIETTDTMNISLPKTDFTKPLAIQNFSSLSKGVSENNFRKFLTTTPVIRIEAPDGGVSSPIATIFRRSNGLIFEPLGSAGEEIFCAGFSGEFAWPIGQNFAFFYHRDRRLSGFRVEYDDQNWPPRILLKDSAGEVAKFAYALPATQASVSKFSADKFKSLMYRIAAAKAGDRILKITKDEAWPILAVYFGRGTYRFPKTKLSLSAEDFYGINTISLKEKPPVAEEKFDGELHSKGKNRRGEEKNVGALPHTQLSREVKAEDLTTLF